MKYKTDKRIIYTNDEGGVTIVHPTGEIPFEDVLKKDVPEGADAVVVDVATISSDRTFRNAWEKDGDKIVINFDKAKLVAHDRWRRWVRQEKLLVVTDEEEQKVRAKYAAFRDEIVAAQDLEVLHSIMVRMGVPE